MSETELKVEVSESGPCERLLTVTIGPDVVRQERERVITEIRKGAKIKGFRPGKAPRNLIEKTYAGEIREEMLNKVISDNFRQALEQEDLSPLSQPTVEDVDLGDDLELEFQARFEVEPKIELKKYTGFTVEKKTEKITDDEIDKAVENLREQNAQFVPKEGRAEKGDYLLLDFQVLDEEGNPDPEGRRENQLVMAGHEDEQALFSHALVSLEEGEGQRIEVDFPKDYPDEALRDRKVVYIVDVKGVRQRRLPEVDEHFVKQISPEEDVEGLRRLIRENLEREVTQQSQREVEEQLFRRIIDESPFEVPPSLVDSAIKRQLDNMRRQGRQVDEARAAELMRPSAEFAVKREYVMAEVAGKEDIKVNEEDIDKKIGEFAEQLGRPLDEVRQDFRSRQAMAQLQSMISVDKVMDFLMRNNEIKEVED